MSKHRIVLTGGGTGGHIYPALAVHERLVKDPNVEAILYIGASDHMEENLCRDRAIEFEGLVVSGMPRSLGLKLFTWPFETMLAVIEARKILGRFFPSAVLGTGGYASAATLLAANQMGVPTIVHEPDAHPGLVNVLFSKTSEIVSLGMDGARSRFRRTRAKLEFNGNPIRASFTMEQSQAEARTALGLDPGLRTIVVTGGSQGARAVNESVLKFIPELLDKHRDVQVIHQVGAKNYDDIIAKLDQSLLDNKRYLLKPYFEEMAVVYAASDFAIGRAGAMTISELTVTGTPCIFIPYPYAAQDHQMHNARYLESRKAACVIPESELSKESLASLIEELILDQERLEVMKKAMLSLGKPDAAAKLAGQLKDVSSLYLSAFN